MASPAAAFAALQRTPQRFAFDAAVRLMQHASGEPDPALAARFRSMPGLGYSGADFTDIRRDEQGRIRATTSVMGLTGATGVMPRYYAEVLGQSLRDRSRAMHDFLDLLSTRIVGHFARAGIKYRFNRAIETARLAPPDPAHAQDIPPDPMAMMLLAISGYATGHLRARLEAGTDAVLHYAGLFGLRPRSADRLAALASDWLGRPVEVEQFAGAWLALAPEERTRLPQGRRPGQFARLGMDAAIGVRAWDIQGRVILRIGPLDLPAFIALLPDRRALHRLVSLVRAYLGIEIGFAVNLVLARDQVPPLRLGTGDPAPRLGWTTWLPAPPGHPRARHPADARFEAEVVEAARPGRHA